MLNSKTFLHFPEFYAITITMILLFLIATIFNLIGALPEPNQCSTREDECHSNVARYDNYRMYYVDIDTEEHVRIFQEIEERSDSYTFYGHARHPGQKLTIMVSADKIGEITDILKTYEVTYKILTYNFQEKIDRQLKDVMPKNTPPEDFDWDHYFHLKTINAWLDKMAADYDFVTTIVIGESVEGVPIKGVKLAKHPDNTAVFVESGIHAREWIAPATATYILNELLTSTDPAVQKAASDFNWIILPVVNPDGYKYTFESDRMWRKNRGLFSTCRGVDLNRNFPHHWNETGASSDPCRYDYAGPSVASEAETKAIIKYITENAEDQNIQTYLSLHSFSQLVMFPYGTEEKAYNFDDLTQIGVKAVEAIKQTTGMIYKSGSIRDTIYPSSGGSKDWAHGHAKIPITFTFELRGAPDSTDLFILPAEQIRDTGRETMAAFVAILEEASGLGYYK